MTILPAIAAALLALAGSLSDPQPGIGDPAPTLELEALSGAAFRQVGASGHITVVDFFATWCGPCRRAHADLAALRASVGPEITVLLIAVGEDPATVRRFATENPALGDAQILLDRTGGNARRWGADRYPTTFIVDSQGTIRNINRGWGPSYRARLQRWLAALRAAPRRP